MIDLTPLDVRKKRGDFAKGIRGYDPREVDHFLEMVAERLEGLVRENLDLKDHVERLSERVQGQEGRENAVQEALVTAQELRKEIAGQARREAELIRREAQAEADRILGEVDRQLQERRRELIELTRSRERFLRSFRSMLERQLDAVEVEQEDTGAVGFDLDALREAAARDAELRVPPRRPAVSAGDGDSGEGESAAGASGAAEEGREEPAEPLDSLLDDAAPAAPVEGDLFSGGADPQASRGSGADAEPDAPRPAGEAAEGDGGSEAAAARPDSSRDPRERR